MAKLDILVVIVVIGVCLGSFVNAYVWRINKRLGAPKKTNRTKTKLDARYSLLFGRSMCPKCEHVLEWIDLIPVISWLSLKGRCRYCKTNISISYPLVEITAVLLFVLSYIYWPYGFSNQATFAFVIWLIIIINLLALAIYDLKWLILPDLMVYPLLGIALLKLAVNQLFFNQNYHQLLGNLMGIIIGGGIFYILFQVSSGKWIGGGDVKLGAVLGLILGSGLYAGMMIFLSSLIGTLIALPLIISGKLNRKTLIPYGPLLILAAIIIELFAASITGWLKTKGYYI